jgi:serine protease Do
VFYRNGERRTATAAVQELRLGDTDRAEGNGHGSATGLGLSLEDLTPDLAQQLRLPAGADGAVVDSVESLSPAAEAGLARGAVILEVTRHAVHAAREAERALREIKSGQLAFLLVSRHGSQVFLEIRKG